MKPLLDTMKSAGAGVVVPDHPLKAIAFPRSEASREELVRRLREISGISLQIAPNREPGAIDADIAFVDVDISSAEDLAFIGRLKMASGHSIDVVAITNAASPQDVMSAVRAGAEDVLVRPIDPKEARNVLDRLTAHRARKRPQTAPRATLIAFAHAAGGAGATTIAVNAAIALAERCKSGEVCLLDFDIQYGAVASHLDIPPASPIRDLVQDPDRLDREMLEGMMTRHASGLRVLTAPRLPLPFEAFNPAIVTRILETAQRHHRFVLVDLPQTLTPWTDAVLRRSSTIYVLTQQGVPAVHQLRKFFDVLIEEHLDDLPLRLVVNRQQGPLGKTADVSSAQIERAIGRPVNHYIPNDYGQIMPSLNQGKPAVMQSRTSRFAQSIRTMLLDVTGDDFFDDKRGTGGLSALSQKLFGG